MARIRKASASDRPDWIRMRKKLFPDCPDDRQNLETDMMLNSDGIVLLAEESEFQLVGFAEIFIRHDHVEGTTESPVPYLEAWYVDPEYQSKGIGKALVEAAEQFALKSGYSQLASDADLDNDSSIEIHKKIGFREVGRSVHFVKSLKS